MMKELLQIQSELKAPKNQWNKFGEFYYRSLEDIFEGLKPLLVANDCILTITDDILEVCGEPYTKATATITNKDGVSYSVSAFAREEKSRPKMSPAQLTGSASSYARKYALGGLLLMEDNKDPDSMNNSKKETPKSQDDDKPRFNDDNFDKLKEAIKEQKIAYSTGDEALQVINQKYKVSKKMQETVLSYFK